MKNIGIQHIEAVKRLKTAGKRFKRTIHLSFVPDEELGGFEGMNLFVKTPEFKAMNVGFSLDEGLASVDDEIPLYYGERNVHQVRITCPGSPGHGSRLISLPFSRLGVENLQKLS